MKIAIDIDGTIAVRNMSVFAHRCNEKFALTIGSTCLEGIKYEDFLRLPEVEAYRQRVGDKQCHQDIRWMDYDPVVLESMIMMPMALEAINLLAGMGSIAYYTARRTLAEQWLDRNEPMEKATRQWLTTQGFPNPKNVVFCAGVKDKLVRLAEYTAANSDQIMLIDDSYEKLLKEFIKLSASHQQTLRQSLTLIAFKALATPGECHGLSVIPQPSWQHLDRIILPV